MKKHYWNSLFYEMQEMGCLGKSQLYSLSYKYIWPQNAVTDQ